MLVVTHDMQLAREVADQVVFLHQGRVAESGAAEAIFQAPQHERTRDFLRRVRSAGL